MSIVASCYLVLQYTKSLAAPYEPFLARQIFRLKNQIQCEILQILGKV